VPADTHARLQATNLFLVVVGIVGVSSSGPLMAAATEVPALAMSLWRTGLAAIVVGATAMYGHRAELKAFARREWVRCGFSGIMLAGHFAAWTSSLRLTSVASATALVCLQVGWVVVLARLSGVRVVGGVWLGLVCSMTGVLVIAGIDRTVSTQALVGDLLALVGGMFAAVYMIVGSRVREHATTAAYTFVCYSTCALVLLLACVVGGVRTTGFDARGWAIIVAVTVTAQLLGHSIFNHLLAVMSPTLISIVLLLEVPGAALLAAVFLGQQPPVAVYAGLVLICCGLALVVRASPPTGPGVLVEVPLD
jgi:drug/metabolite transporter (DMT)-like permease